MHTVKLENYNLVQSCSLIWGILMSMRWKYCKKTCPSSSGFVEGSRCDAAAKLAAALQKFFKFDNFRPGQRQALLPLMHKKDVFLRMATGAGKSRCMFLAPLSLNDVAVGLVINPLHGLMEQQVFT